MKRAYAKMRPLPAEGWIERLVLVADGRSGDARKNDAEKGLVGVSLYSMRRTRNEGRD